jgi:hypothetical protein
MGVFVKKSYENVTFGKQPIASVTVLYRNLETQGGGLTWVRRRVGRERSLCFGHS